MPEPAVAPRAGSSAVGLFLCTAPAVPTIVWGAVASELTADGAGVSTHELGDCRVREPWHLFPQRGERIPLRRGDLVIVQHDDPFLAERFVSVPDRPSLLLGALHLLLEFTPANSLQTASSADRTKLRPLFVGVSVCHEKKIVLGIT